jgi:hypothetical protein
VRKVINPHEKRLIGRAIPENKAIIFNTCVKQWIDIPWHDNRHSSSILGIQDNNRPIEAEVQSCGFRVKYHVHVTLEQHVPSNNRKRDPVTFWDRVSVGDGFDIFARQGLKRCNMVVHEEG